MQFLYACEFVHAFLFYRKGAVLVELRETTFKVKCKRSCVTKIYRRYTCTPVWYPVILLYITIPKSLILERYTVGALMRNCAYT